MSDYQYLPPRLLEPADDVAGFTCRSSEQTTWLRRYARQSAATGTTRVFVVTSRGNRDVVAYYAWCMAQIDIESAPPRLAKGAGRSQPVNCRDGLIENWITRNGTTR